MVRLVNSLTSTSTKLATGSRHTAITKPMLSVFITVLYQLSDDGQTRATPQSFHLTLEDDELLGFFVTLLYSSFKKSHK